ncbi:MAG TPA: hypothetical protein VF411_06510, partial [Bacteroidia bacterium]
MKSKIHEYLKVKQKNFRKKYLFTFLLICIISFSGYTQVMSQRAYQRNTSTAYGGQQTNDGGYIMSGLVTVTSTDY